MSAMTVENFRMMAESKKYKTPHHSDSADLENIYWNRINHNSPFYGADVPGSLTDNDLDVCI